MTILISEICSPGFPNRVVTLAGIFTLAFFALPLYTVFRSAVSMKQTLVLPLFAAAAQFLFETANYPMTVLKP